MKYLRAFVFLAFLLSPFCLSAETVTEFNAKKINKELDAIEKKISSGNIDRQIINEDLKNINLLQSQINQAKTEYNNKLQNVQKRLTALGEAPKEGAKEAKEIADSRKVFAFKEEQNKATLAQIELINTRIEEISNLILKVRNQTLFNKILVRQTSIFQLKEFGKSIWSFCLFIFDLLKSPYSWYKNLTPEQQHLVNKNSGFVIIIFLLILGISTYLNIYIRKRFGYRDCKENPTLSQKLQSAIAMIFAFGLIPAVTLGGFILWLNDTQIINNGNWGKLLYLLALYILAFFLILATIRVIFVPKCGNWRIVDMTDQKAKSISTALIWCASFMLITQFLLQFALTIATNEETVYSLKILAITTEAFSIIYIARKFLYTPPPIPRSTDDENSDHLTTETKISLLITIFTLFTFIISLFGYVRLSEFIINRFLLTIAVITIFWLLGKLIRLLLRQILRLNFWQDTFHISLRFLAKLEFWFDLLLKPLLWLGLIIAILGIWGFSVDIMLHDVKNFLLGFNIGNMRVSIASILLGIGAFIISMFIFKNLKSSVQTGQLSKIDMLEDSRNSLAAGISLIGFIVSLMVAFAVMGGSLNSIAIIAGALSFGVGLGMQNIVSNFVSGIIIIFERPIKIGDWVTIGGQEGIVRAINMRSTRLESFNKSDIIIPNSTILSGTLINMTYLNKIGKIEIKVSVKINSNVKKVEETLIKIAGLTAGILSNPEPSVAFLDISGGQLIFSLNCFTANIYNRQSIINQIRENILTEFTANEITLTGA